MPWIAGTLVFYLIAVIITRAVNVPEPGTWAVSTMTAISAAQASKATAPACCGEGPAELLPQR